MFDESSFPFADLGSAPPSSHFEFLDFDETNGPLLVGHPFFSGTPTDPSHVSPAAPASPQVVASEVSPGTPDAALGSSQIVTSIGHPSTMPTGTSSMAHEPPPGFFEPPAVVPPTSAPHTGAVAPPASAAPLAGAIPMPPAGAVSPASAICVPPAGAILVPPVDNAHSIRTRGKDGFRQPKKVLDLQVSSLSPIPKTYRGALSDPNWRDAMIEEFSALQANHTCDIVPPPRGVNIVSGKWVYRHKLHPDGTLDRYKARWVLRGFT